MAPTRGGFAVLSRSRSGPRSEDRDPEVEELLRNLHLTTEEMEIAELSDDKDEDTGNVEMAVIGKVLSPVAIHASTILGAMNPAWGNPAGLKIRTVGEKGNNLFVAEFGDGQAMERVLMGSPWIVGKYAIILQPWMNEKRGAKAASLIGELVKLDVDRDGKASGAFLRARVSVELSKPLRSHTKIECENPVVRNAEGKLLYNIKLHAANTRKQQLQGFIQAAAISFGSSSSASSHQSKESGNRQGGKGEWRNDGGKEGEEGEEVKSPVKSSGGDNQKALGTGKGGASKQLFHLKEPPVAQPARKRKSKMAGSGPKVTPDLNLTAEDLSALVMVPVGLVSTRVL
ncbi:hypothetical protein QOZ80_5BG0439700 [Eleusine coracana subsp. coracana]|nr:hypothetical protein QOZ80_5BG0439700 [Eleusine coracana subsp. coracana]